MTRRDPSGTVLPCDLGGRKVCRPLSRFALACGRRKSTRDAHPAGWPLLLLVVVSAALVGDVKGPSSARAALDGRRGDPGACAGHREPTLDAVPLVLLYELRSAAFPEAGAASVAVHVPPGFDASRRPGLVVYFHGWQGCVSAALSDEDVPCSAEGDARPGAALAHQVDAAGVNALLVAVELRIDRSTGEPGQLAVPGRLRDLLRELFDEHLSDLLGCSLEVEGLDRIVVMAHSGGYQAAASVLEFGDLPQITEVDLLDALYGADEAFASWIRDSVAVFDPRERGPRRFVDLYTCCGGTVETSRSLADAAHRVAESARWNDAVHTDDGDEELKDQDLRGHPIVFKRVPRGHADLPRAYARRLIEAAGFARIGGS